jgi:hypothetical protein
VRDAFYGNRDSGFGIRDSQKQKQKQDQELAHRKRSYVAAGGCAGALLSCGCVFWPVTLR